MDNKDLYRFSKNLPKKSCVRSTPLRTCTNTSTKSISDQSIGSSRQPVLHRRMENAKPRLQSVCKTLKRTEVTWHHMPSVIEFERVWMDTLLDQLGLALNLRDPREDIFNGSVVLNAKHVIHNSVRIGPSGIVDSLDRSKELPYWVLSAMKCLVTWPKASGVESCLPNYPGFERDVFRVVRDYFATLEEPLTTFAMYSALSSVHRLTKQFDGNLRMSNEVDVLGVNRNSSSVDNLSDRLSSAAISVEPKRLGVSTPSIVSIRSTTLCFETDFGKASPITQVVCPSAQSGDSVLKILLNESGGYVNLACTSTSSAITSCRRSQSEGYVNLGCTELSNDEDHYVPAPDRRLRRSFSSIQLPESDISDPWTRDALRRHYCNDQFPYTSEGKCHAIEALQLCLLLLSPDSRRNFHRLLRFMLRVADNRQLQLDVSGLSNRQLVLDTFGECLLRPAVRADVDEAVSVSLVAFLVDNHDVILSEPTHLVADVNTQLAKLEAKKVSESEYERQKRTMSERAIAGLLDNILSDGRLSEHDKRRKLKQFQKMYPAIYADKFPQAAEDVSSQPAALDFKKPFKKLLKMRL